MFEFVLAMFSVFFEKQTHRSDLLVDINLEQYEKLALHICIEPQRNAWVTGYPHTFR